MPSDGLPDWPRFDVAAERPRFDDLDVMAAASDVIVEGVVTQVDAGRVLTDPADPGAGIRTQLAAVSVLAAVATGDVDDAPSDGLVVVEQEAELLDGTPLRVNGVDPLVVGDRGLMFLIDGDTDEFPDAAFVNEQGWIPIVDDGRIPLDADDPIWSGRTPPSPAALLDAIAAGDD